MPCLLKDYCKIDPYIKDSYVSLPNSFLDPNDLNYIGSINGICALTMRSDGTGDRTGVSSNESCLDNVAIALDEEVSKSRKREFGMINTISEFWGKLGITDIQNVKVDHCNQAYGVRIWSCEGWSLVFSGDTRPCDSLVELGRGATILIHEATFDSTKGEEAMQKKHTTVDEAYRVHADMDSFRLILTHFSQRYPNIPPHFRFNPNDQKVASAGLSSDSSPFMPCPASSVDAIFASDFLMLNFSDLTWAPSTTAIMAAAFPVLEDEEEEEVAIISNAVRSLESICALCSPETNMQTLCDEKVCSNCNQMPRSITGGGMMLCSEINAAGNSTISSQTAVAYGQIPIKKQKINTKS